MQANPNFNLAPGYFTDDTSMALCLAHSLLENGPVTVSVDQARKYLAWYRKGYQSSTGRCFDIGNLTRDALGVWKHAVAVNDQYGENGASPQAPKDQSAIQSAQATIDKRFNQDRYSSNGSLMRVLPAALLFSQDLPTAAKAAADSSRVTHPHPRCVLSCALYTILIAQSLQEPKVTKDSLVGHISDYISAVKDAIPPSTSKSKSTSGHFLERFEPYTTLISFHDKPAIKIRSSGYVLDSLEAALWAFFTTSSFREGAIKVVNLGGDADTVGAIYGGLAGAFYGGNQIPEEWLRDMKRLDLVEDVVEKIVTVRSKEEKEDVSRDARPMIQASVGVLGL
jgi:ADP-ribosyl-[dinitrogen reductase] hydrolase